jgi:hypothetical protein
MEATPTQVINYFSGFKQNLVPFFNDPIHGPSVNGVRCGRTSLAFMVARITTQIPATSWVPL